MRESRLSGSVEGVMSDHDSYSDSWNESLVCAIARCRGVAVDAAAGRISSTVARRKSQYTATAAAPAIIVARTNTAKFTRIHMSAFLPCLRSALRYRTEPAIRNWLKIKEL